MFLNQDIINIILLTIVGGVFSLIGGIIIMFIPSLSRVFIKYASSFTAAAIIAAILTDLIPESIKLYGYNKTIIATTVGFCVFFMLNKSLDWFHHHHQHDGDTYKHPHNSGRKKRLPAMLIIGDTLHNFLDGLAIAIAYIANPGLGLTSALLSAMHELPQEIGDFGLLLSHGYSKKKVLIINLISASFVIMGGILGYSLKGLHELRWGLLGLSIGFLLSLATFDLLPDIKAEDDKKQLAVFLIGLFATALVILTIKNLGIE